MIVAALLALPVAWIYIMTRRKKGYRQSIVHTLITLPVVIAGVVVLVKSSLALAFSLAGIVAAVRFRNTLEDSKDAVYIFVATGIGLAAGVELTVAVVLSVIFNAVILFLWYSDFGRTPAVFEGGVAERRLERARAHANRASSFVAKLDEDVLKAMSSEQLDALADRAWRRRKRHEPEMEIDDDERRFETMLRVRTTNVDAAMQVTESALGDHLKRWKFGGIVHEEDGNHVIEYAVQLKKSVDAKTFVDTLRERGGAQVVSVELH